LILKADVPAVIDDGKCRLRRSAEFRESGSRITGQPRPRREAGVRGCWAREVGASALEQRALADWACSPETSVWTSSARWTRLRRLAAASRRDQLLRGAGQLVPRARANRCLVYAWRAPLSTPGGELPGPQPGRVGLPKLELRTRTPASPPGGALLALATGYHTVTVTPSL